MAGRHHCRRPSLALPWAGELIGSAPQTCQPPIKRPLANRQALAISRAATRRCAGANTHRVMLGGVRRTSSLAVRDIEVMAAVPPIRPGASYRTRTRRAESLKVAVASASANKPRVLRYEFGMEGRSVACVWPEKGPVSALVPRSMFLTYLQTNLPPVSDLS